MGNIYLFIDLNTEYFCVSASIMLGDDYMRTIFFLIDVFIKCNLKI